MFFILSTVAGCRNDKGFTRDELQLIRQDSVDGIMRVLTVRDPADEATLRRVSAPLNAEHMNTEDFRLLCDRMLRTVCDPSQDGVGIAAPQVGILRRLIAVQRFDIEGEPFGFYVNPVITATRGEKVRGQEGCLSIPEESGIVPRYQDIDIEYLDPETGHIRTERIEGFTAVIFQHETDHLDGVLFTDHTVTTTAEPAEKTTGEAPGVVTEQGR